MSDLIKLVLTSSDAHLSYSPVLCRPKLILIRTGIAKQVYTIGVSVCKWNLVSYW